MIMPAKKITFDFFSLSRLQRAQKTELATSEVQQTPAGPRAVATLPTSKKAEYLLTRVGLLWGYFGLPKVLRGRDRYQKTRMEKVEYECDLENRERMSRDLQKWEKPSKIEKSAVFRP